MAYVSADTYVEVLAAGLVFADLVFEDAALPGPGQESFARAFAFSPGAAANQAVAAARLGRRTALLAQLGQDPMGTLVREWLGGIELLDLRYCHTRPGLHTPVSAAVAHAGDRSFISYLQDEPDLAPPEQLRAGALNVATSRELPGWVLSLVESGTHLVLSTAWDATGRWDPADLAGLQHADTLIINTDEALAYTRRTTVPRAAEALLEHVAQVVVTQGPHGATALDRSGSAPVQVPGLPVHARDATGAGDVFIGAWLATHDAAVSLRERVQVAVLASGLSVGGLGGAASAPTARDMLTYLHAHPSGLDSDRIISWLASHDTARPTRSTP